MQRSPMPHFMNVRPREEPDYPIRPSVWPWTTALMGLAAIGIALLSMLTIESKVVRPSPRVQAAEAKHEADIHQTKLREEAQARLEKLQPLLSKLESQFAAFKSSLRTDLGLAGDGVTYADFVRPEELDLLIAHPPDDTIPAAWTTIELALPLRPTIQELARKAGQCARRQTVADADIETLDMITAQAQSALDQVGSAREAVHHLSISAKAQALYGDKPMRKEP